MMWPLLVEAVKNPVVYKFLNGDHQPLQQCCYPSPMATAAAVASVVVAAPLPRHQMCSLGACTWRSDPPDSIT